MAAPFSLNGCPLMAWLRHTIAGRRARLRRTLGSDVYIVVDVVFTIRRFILGLKKLGTQFHHLTGFGRVLIQRRLQDKAVTLEELSGQYDVSRERIRQIEVRAFEKLQARMQELAKDRGLLEEA